MSTTGKLYAYTNTKIEATSGNKIFNQSSATVPNDRCLSAGVITGTTATEYWGIDTSGGVHSSLSNTDVQTFAGARNWTSYSTGTNAVLTRLAAGNYAYVQAASVTDTYVLDLGEFIAARTTAGKGFELTSFDLIYLPITASLTSITPTLYKTTYANNTAAVIASTGAGLGITAGTNTLTVPSTGPWVFNQVITTPAYFNPAGDQGLFLEVAIVTPATAVPNFYGVNLYFTTVPF